MSDTSLYTWYTEVGSLLCDAEWLTYTDTVSISLIILKLVAMAGITLGTFQTPRLYANH
jgi:hypothetical protein